MPIQRLKTRAQFQAVMNGGATVSRTPHFALHRLELDGAQATAAGPGPRPPPLSLPLFPRDARQHAWVGAMAPKRWARRAVTRNTVKRQVYALSQTFEQRLHGAAHVVRLRAAFDRARFVSATSEALKAALRAELLQLLDRLPAACAADTAAAVSR